MARPDAVSIGFEDVGLLLSAADSAAQAALCTHPPAATGKRGVVGTALPILAELCGGATTAAIRSAARPLPVTSREREIVGLLLRDIKSRDRRRLTLSVRTV